MSLKSKGKRLISAVLALAMAAGMLAGCGAAGAPAQASAASAAASAAESGAGAAVTIRDGDGNTFTFDKPITRAVVYDRYNTEVFRAVGACGVMVGVDQDAVDTYPKYWTGVGDTVKIVGASCTDFNVEKIVEIKPDAVFTSSLGEYESMRDQLKKFGIPVIVINAWKPSEFYDYITLVGNVTGHADQAAEYISFCKNAMAAVNTGLASIPDSQKKTVYFENGGQYKTCLKGSGWNDMIESAGGVNIFGDVKFDSSDSSKGNTSSYEVDPEAIIKADPDVIIENIYSTKEHSKLEATVELADGELEQELETFAGRAGWGSLDAVKNKQVYGFTSFLGNANSKLVAIMYISKWLYPDTFRDLDPDAFFKQWCTYMGFDQFEGYAAGLA